MKPNSRIVAASGAVLALVIGACSTSDSGLAAGRVEGSEGGRGGSTPVGGGGGPDPKAESRRRRGTPGYSVD